jgi:hypothetical protein
VVVATVEERRGEGEERRRRGGEMEGHGDGDREKSDPLQSPAPVRFQYPRHLEKIEDKFIVETTREENRKFDQI